MSAGRNSKLLVGDTVIVTSGASKGEQGKVLRFTHGGTRAVVEGVARATKHVKPVPAMGREGGLTTIDTPVAVSNLAFVDSAGKAVRLGYKTSESGQKVRVSRSTGDKV